jgi:transcription elongation factor Elf1
VNQQEIEREFTCRTCGWEGEVVGYTDDSGIILYAVCPSCKDEMTIDLGAENDPMFADPDDYWEE